MDGFLLIDKPCGLSSFAVVAQVRRAISIAAGKRVKVGHTGTLDPAASGLLILVVGNYTKKAHEFSKLDKTYEAELHLGQTSTTADREGALTNISAHRPSDKDVQNVLNSFIGQISQTPPAFSAIKVNGQRAYKLAREGKPVEMKARPATIYSIDKIAYDYPKLSFTTTVSSGTYIRSLAVDIGQKLGTGAYLSALRRTEVGKYKVKSAISFHALTSGLIHRKIATNGQHS